MWGTVLDMEDKQLTTSSWRTGSLFLQDLQLSYTTKYVNQLQWWRHEKSGQRSAGTSQVKPGRVTQKHMGEGHMAGRDRKWQEGAVLV